jgi:hypothetical protein
VVVAVVSVRVMQVTVDEVVDVVAVGDGFVATLWTVDVVRGVGAALVRGGAVGWIGRVHFEGVFIHMVVVHVMQVAVVEVVDVVVVFDGGVSAAFAVDVVVGFVFLAVDHLWFPFTI